jgi:hypothetical protein
MPDGLYPGPKGFITYLCQFTIVDRLCFQSRWIIVKARIRGHSQFGIALMRTYKKCIYAQKKKTGKLSARLDSVSMIGSKSPIFGFKSAHRVVQRGIYHVYGHKFRPAQFMPCWRIRIKFR